VSIEMCSNGESKKILNMLKFVYLSLTKVKVQRIIAVKFKMYSRCGDGAGCFEVKAYGRMQRS